MEYATYDNFMDALLRWGLEAQFVKQDLKDAFRHPPFAASDQWLLTFHGDGRYWKEEYLIIRLRTSSFILNPFAKALHWIIAGGPELDHSVAHKNSKSIASVTI